MIRTVSFIGSGNVATHLAKALQSHCKIKQIWSREFTNAEVLANTVNAEPIHQINHFKEVDLILICVPDHAIESIVDQLISATSIIAHTSGASGLDFSQERMACFYPLQTFKKEQNLDMSNCPFFVIAKNEDDQETLLELANKLTNNAKVITKEQKLKLHLAAVFVNNYVNHLFGLTEEFLSNNQLNFLDLAPIIATTIQRALNEKPFDIQTGPAIRRDEKTIETHLSLLNENKEMKEVYEFLARSIQKKHHNEE